MIQRTRALASFSSAKEYASIQRAVLAAALPTSNTTKGKLSDNDRSTPSPRWRTSKSRDRSFTRPSYADARAEPQLPARDRGWRAYSTSQGHDEYAVVPWPRSSASRRLAASGPTATG
ncbi:hypothetical protein GCM10023238_18560 [Streptomyces heliomycini]